MEITVFVCTVNISQCLVALQSRAIKWWSERKSGHYSLDIVTQRPLESPSSKDQSLAGGNSAVIAGEWADAVATREFPYWGAKRCRPRGLEIGCKLDGI